MYINLEARLLFVVVTIIVIVSKQTVTGKFWFRLVQYKYAASVISCHLKQTKMSMVTNEIIIDLYALSVALTLISIRTTNK